MINQMMNFLSAPKMWFIKFSSLGTFQKHSYEISIEMKSVRTLWPSSSISRIHPTDVLTHLLITGGARRFTEALLIVAKGWKLSKCLLFGGGLVAKSCLTLATPWTCNLPGTSVRGILQTRILEWVAISFSKGIFLTQESKPVSCIAGRFFTETSGKSLNHYSYS